MDFIAVNQKTGVVTRHSKKVAAERALREAEELLEQTRLQPRRVFGVEIAQCSEWGDSFVDYLDLDHFTIRMPVDDMVLFMPQAQTAHIKVVF